MASNSVKLSYLSALVLAVVAGFGFLFTSSANAAVGIEYNFEGGQTSGAYDTDSGAYWGLSISVPLWKNEPVFGGDIMGEILLGYSRTHVGGTYTAPPAGVSVIGLPITGGVTAATAPGGPQTRFNLSVLQVGPGLRYKIMSIPSIGSPIDPAIQIVPYLAVGMTFNVYLGSTEDGDTNGCGPRIGGVACEPAELLAIGFPVGQGNVLPGIMYGGGVDFFIYSRMIVGLEFRQNTMVGNSNANYHTILGKIGLTF